MLVDKYGRSCLLFYRCVVQCLEIRKVFMSKITRHIKQVMQGNNYKRQQQKSFKADKHNNVREQKAIKSGGGSDIDT